jgi:hypothetical protein
MFTFSEFIEALVRVGCEKFPEERADRGFNKIVKKILKNADQQCFETFNKVFNVPAIWRVYAKHARITYSIFMKYAADDKSDQASLASMNIKEAFWFYQVRS